MAVLQSFLANQRINETRTSGHHDNLVSEYNLHDVFIITCAATTTRRGSSRTRIRFRRSRSSRSKNMGSKRSQQRSTVFGTHPAS
jgi:hypothetical protein